VSTKEKTLCILIPLALNIPEKWFTSYFSTGTTIASLILYPAIIDSAYVTFQLAHVRVRLV
jgi:hypothetical protein